MESTRQIADRLLAFLREERNVEAIDALYADDIETIEADPSRTRSGKGIVRASMADFEEAFDFRYLEIEGPLVAGDSFALHLKFEARPKGGGESFEVDEIGVYQVRDGKIAREQFHYATA